MQGAKKSFQTPSGIRAKSVRVVVLLRVGEGSPSILCYNNPSGPVSCPGSTFGEMEKSDPHILGKLSSTQGLRTVFKQGQAFDEIHNDVIHSKCISKTNFMSGIDVYVYHWPYSNII